MLFLNLSTHQSLARMAAQVMFPSMRKDYRVHVKILLNQRFFCSERKLSD